MPEKYFRSYLLSLLFLLLSAILFMTVSIDDNAESVKMIKSPYSYNKTISNIKTAIVSNNFNVVRQHDSSNAHTFYFCNFNVAYKAIQRDKRVGVLLPCKIKIIKTKNKVYIATINVNSIQKLTGVNIGSLCGKIKRSIDQIIAEAVI